jgi:hypothetical protein
MVPLFAIGIIDTDGKFAADVVNTGGSKLGCLTSFLKYGKDI